MADSLKIRIDGDDSGFKKSLSNIGKVAKTSLGVTIKAIGAASAGISGLTALSINSYKKYEQLVGGVDTLFEESSKKVQENAAKAYKTAGMSANQYMETVTSFSASLKQSFEDTAEGIDAASDVADMAIQDMSDNTNKMGTDMQRIQDAYQGFAKQNYTMLDNLKLGYGGTKTEMERLLSDAEKLSGVKYDISNLADVYNAIHVIQTELGITGTTAKEASTTIEGSIGMMKASFTNLITGMADDNADFDALLDEFIDSVLTVGDNLLPRIETTITGVGDLISGASEKLVPEIVDIIVDSSPLLIDASVDVINSFVKGLSNNSEKIAKATVIIAETLIEGLLDIIPEVIDAAEDIISSFAKEIGDAIPLLKPITSIISVLGKNLKALTTIVVAGVAAWKTYNAVGLVTKTLTTSWGVATSTLTAMQKANALTLVASNGGLSLYQTLVGLVTGKITLQTAATGMLTGAQTALNAAMAANPIGVVIIALVALAAACYGVYKAVTAETEAEKAHRIALEENNAAIRERTKALEESQKAFSEEILSSRESYEHTKDLADELFTLADASGNVADADRARADFILGELNNALGTEYSMVDGQIKKYDELQSSIYDTIEAKKAESYLNAYREEYEAALKKEKEDREALTKQQAMMNDILTSCQ